MSAAGEASRSLLARLIVARQSACAFNAQRGTVLLAPDKPASVRLLCLLQLSLCCCWPMSLLGRVTRRSIPIGKNMIVGCPRRQHGREQASAVGQTKKIRPK